MFFERIRSVSRRLSVRLTLWHSLLFMGSAIGLLVLTNFLLRNRAGATEHYVVESRLNQYLSEYKASGLAGIRHLSTLRRGRAQQAFFVRVGDASNQTVFLRHAEDWAEFRPEELSRLPLPPPGKRTWGTQPSDDGTSLIYASERLPDGGVLQVGKANEEFIDLMADYRRASVLVLLIFVPASFAGGAFLTSRTLRPVQHLTKVAQEIVDTNRFDTRVPSAGSGGELAALVQVFNVMLGRIEALIRGMRESLDNVAHDLRTPLTRIRHKAQGVIEADQHVEPEMRELHRRQAVDALGDCVEESDRLCTMLNTIMDIAEADAGLVKLDRTDFSLQSLISQAVDSYAEFAEERNARVAIEVAEDVEVHADKTALFRVLANLIDNAIKYTPAGGHICIETIASLKDVTVRIKDDGIGISSEDLPRVWDRLFRGNRSRTERGLGLGLSFVRAIVEAHGGSVQMESKPGIGTAVSFTLSNSSK